LGGLGGGGAFVGAGPFEVTGSTDIVVVVGGGGQMGTSATCSGAGGGGGATTVTIDGELVAVASGGGGGGGASVNNSGPDGDPGRAAGDLLSLGAGEAALSSAGCTDSVGGTGGFGGDGNGGDGGCSNGGGGGGGGSPPGLAGDDGGCDLTGQGSQSQAGRGGESAASLPRLLEAGLLRDPGNASESMGAGLGGDSSAMGPAEAIAHGTDGRAVLRFE